MADRRVRPGRGPHRDRRRDHGAVLTKIGKAAEGSEEQPSEELDRLLRSPRRYLTWVSALLYAAVIFVMVVKPFS